MVACRHTTALRRDRVDAQPRVVAKVGDLVGAVAIDAGGNVTAGGNSGEDAFVSRLGVDGRLLWQWRSTGGRGAKVEALVIDGDDVVAVGNFREKMALAKTKELTSAGDGDCFLARIDGRDGRVVAAARVGGAGDDLCRSITRSDSGFLVAGSFAESITLGANVFASHGSHDIFVAKTTRDFATVWARQFGGRGNDIARGIRADGRGESVLVGQFSGEIKPSEGSVDFGGGTLVSAGDFDAVVVKLDADGRHQWSRRLGGPGFDIAKSAAFGREGEVYVVGSFQGEVPLDSGVPMITLGHLEGFTARFSAAGEEQWIRRTPTVISFHAVDVDQLGRAVVIGHFERTAEIGNCRAASVGGSDVVMTLIASDGGCVEAWRTGTNRDDYGYAVAVRGGELVGGGQLGSSDDKGAGFVAVTNLR